MGTRTEFGELNTPEIVGSASAAVDFEMLSATDATWCRRASNVHVSQPKALKVNTVSSNAAEGRNDVHSNQNFVG